MIRVYIWKPSELNSMGHAAMEMGVGSNEKVYVSWYPKDDPSFMLYFGNLDKGNGDIWCSKGVAKKSLDEEIKQGNRYFTYVSLRRGLDLAKMKTAWQQVLEKNEWCLGQSNCSDVIYNLLLAGGGPRRESLDDFANRFEKANAKRLGPDASFPGLLQWKMETTKDDIVNRLRSETKAFITPMRLYNYCVVLKQYLIEQESRKPRPPRGSSEQRKRGGGSKRVPKMKPLIFPIE